MLMDRDAIIAASEIVVADDFYQRQYGIMFDTMVELFNEGKPVDLVTLQDRLKEKDVPPEVCSLDFVRDILATVPARMCAPMPRSSWKGGSPPPDQDQRGDRQQLLFRKGQP